MKKIAFLTYAYPETGLGHWFRTLALAQAAERREHLVFYLGNRMHPGKAYYQVRENEPIDLWHVFDQLRPDILVADLQTPLSDEMHAVVCQRKCQLVILNGIGREEEERADLVIIQGYSDRRNDHTYAGPQYVVLRPELFKLRYQPGASWLVWGGARDKMGLLTAFNASLSDERAMLLTVDGFTDQAIIDQLRQRPNPLQPTFRIQDESIFTLMAVSKAACIAMGMVAWELAALGVPTYAFSWSAGHLHFAQRMEAAGLLRAWPEVGLPDTKHLVDFLSEPFKPTGPRPDAQGAERVLDLIERL